MEITFNIMEFILGFILVLEIVLFGSVFLILTSPLILWIIERKNKK